MKTTKNFGNFLFEIGNQDQTLLALSQTSLQKAIVFLQACGTRTGDNFNSTLLEEVPVPAVSSEPRLYALDGSTMQCGGGNLTQYLAGELILYLVLSFSAFVRLFLPTHFRLVHSTHLYLLGRDDIGLEK